MPTALSFDADTLNSLRHLRPQITQLLAFLHGLLKHVRVCNRSRTIASRAALFHSYDGFFSPHNLLSSATFYGSNDGGCLLTLSAHYLHYDAFLYLLQLLVCKFASADRTTTDLDAATNPLKFVLVVIFGLGRL